MSVRPDRVFRSLAPHSDVSAWWHGTGRALSLSPCARHYPFRIILDIVTSGDDENSSIVIRAIPSELKLIDKDLR